MANFELGRILPVFKGQYSNTADYTTLDIVYYLGSSYVAKRATTGHAPSGTSNPYWQIVAMKGELSGVLSQDQMDAIVEAVTDQGFSPVAMSGSYMDLNDTPEIPDPANGRLVIQRNGEQIGVFDPYGDSTINVTVPTNVNQLSGTDEFYRTPNAIDMEREADDSVIIDVIENGALYYSPEPISKLTINSVGFNDMIESFKKRDTEFRVTVMPGFILEAPDVLRMIGDMPAIESNTEWLITIHLDTIKVEVLSGLKK